MTTPDPSIDNSASARVRPGHPDWLSPAVARTEVLAGLVVALELIPEAISFSILAGLDPRVVCSRRSRWR
jgi:sulfate permease, SulP family